MSDLEKNALLSFKDVVKNLLRNTRESNYMEIAQKTWENYKVLGLKMSIKLNYLHAILPAFHKILILLQINKMNDFTFYLAYLNTCTQLQLQQPYPL